jgi:hypothetical protein
MVRRVSWAEARLTPYTSMRESGETSHKSGSGKFRVASHSRG